MAITGIQSENQQMAVRTGNPLVMNTPQPASYSGSGITYLATDVVGDSRRSLIPAAETRNVPQGKCSGTT
jgi:hypothetical protein